MKAIMKTTKSAPKKAGHGVPFEEMCRLMRVYGPIKSLRNRQKAGGNMANAKVDSVRRKFYRWFPDLDERFARDGAGYFRPKFGHGFEMKYREEMRTRDGEVLSRKRAGSRKQRRSGGEEAAAATANNAEQDRGVPSSIALPRAVSPSSTSFYEQAPPAAAPVVFSALPSPLLRQHPEERFPVMEIKLELEPEEEDRAASASIIADTEPLEHTFVADQDIFDNVDESFYGPNNVRDDCPSLPFADCPPGLLLSSSSCSSMSEEERTSTATSRGVDSSYAEDTLDKFMAEYCEEILASDGDGMATHP